MTGVTPTTISPPSGDAPFDAPPARQSPFVAFLRRSRRHGGLMLGASILFVIVVAALAAPLIAPHDPYAQNLAQRLIPPIWHSKGTWDHVFPASGLRMSWPVVVPT